MSVGPPVAIVLAWALAFQAVLAPRLEERLGSFPHGLADTEDGATTAAGCVLGMALACRAILVLLRATLVDGDVVDRDGMMRATSVLGIMMQIAFYPPMLLMAWRASGWRDDFLATAWIESPSRCYEYALMLGLVGYLLNDLFGLDPSRNGDLIAHHFLCAACLLGHAFYPIPGTVVFLLGTVLLEIGSLSYCVSRVVTDSDMVMRAYAVIMTLSNLGAILSFPDYVSYDDHFNVRVFMGAATVCLTFLRQRAMVKAVMSWVDSGGESRVQKKTD